MEQEGLFRKRGVFRPAADIIRFGGASIVTAPALIATGIVLAGTATGSTPGVGSTATGAIVFASNPITTIELLINAQGPIALSGTATGVQRLTGSAAGQIALAGSAVAANTASGPIVFGGNATAATYFTSEIAGGMALSGSAAGVTPSTTATGAVVLGGSIDPSKLDVTGGTLEAATQITPIALAGTATGINALRAGDVTGVINFTATTVIGSSDRVIGVAERLVFKAKPWRITFKV